MDRDHLFSRAQVALDECGNVLERLNTLPSSMVPGHERATRAVSMLAERIALSARMALEAYAEAGLPAGDRAGKRAERILIAHIELAERCVPTLKQQLERGSIYA